MTQPERHSWERWLAPSLALLALALTWQLRSPLHHLPLERDEGAYALIAVRWLGGSIPYRDLFDHKPPFVYLVYALSRLLPGDPVSAVRALATLYLLATGLALLALGWRLYGRWAAVAGLAAFLVYGSSLRFQGLTFNTEAVLALPATLGCLLVVWSMQTQRLATLALAGVCVGLAALSKPVGALLGLPLCLAPLLSQPRRYGLRAAALALAGALLPALLFVAAFWAWGALPAAREALLTYNDIYAAESIGRVQAAFGLGRIWKPMLTLALPALGGLVATRMHLPWRSAAHAVTALWGLALLATAVLSLRDFPHYYVAALPWLSLWAGALIVALASWLARRSAGQAAAALAFALLAGLLAPPLLEIWPLRAMTPAQQIEALYGVEGTTHFWAAADVADYVSSRLGRSRSLFVWAAEPEIYYLADRRPTTRFIYDYPFATLPGARDEALGILRRAPPQFIITYRDVRPIGFYPLADDLSYRVAARIGGFDIFRRNE